MKKYVEALMGLDWEAVLLTAKKEASRQVGEMQRWRDNHQKFDPDGMLWEYESLFPLVKKAERYRMRIYNRNREMEKIKFDIKVAHVNQDQEEVDRLQDSMADLEAEQMGLVWRILKIYCYLKSQVIMAVGAGVDDVLTEFEYDPEKFA